MSQFETWAKKKSKSFRSDCLRRNRLLKKPINPALIPDANSIYQWLLTFSQIAIKTDLLDGLAIPCAYTGELVKLADIQIDHKTPVSRGGSFAIDNLAVTSGKTNQHKGNLTVAEFLAVLNLISTFDAVAKNSILSRLRSGGVWRKR